jgi:hypothetical protein
MTWSEDKRAKKVRAHGADFSSDDLQIGCVDGADQPSEGGT